LVEFNGQPAISYHSDETGGVLKYAYFTGTMWCSKVIGSRPGTYTSLAVINEEPAISFYDYTERNLMYRQLDSSQFPTEFFFLPLSVH